MVRLFVALCFLGVFGSCRKGAQPTIDDSGGPGRVPQGLLDLVEVLPEGTAGFGYVELGDALRDVPPMLAEYRGAFVDLMDMANRLKPTRCSLLIE